MPNTTDHAAAIRELCQPQDDVLVDGQTWVPQGVPDDIAEQIILHADAQQQEIDDLANTERIAQWLWLNYSNHIYNRSAADWYLLHDQTQENWTSDAEELRQFLLDRT